MTRIHPSIRAKLVPEILPFSFGEAWMRVKLLCFGASVLLVQALPAKAQTPTVINFDQFSASSFFQSVQPPLTVGVATFSGGQLLNATSSLPADPTTVYGTAFFCAGCLPTITIDFSQAVSNLSLLVLNGQTFTVVYKIQDNVGDTSTIMLVANFLSGAGTITLPSTNIRQVTITGDASAWDFFIDNVTFQQCAVTGVTIRTNENCDASINPNCSANIVLADGSETTEITTAVQPPQAITVNVSADFGTAPPTSGTKTDSSGSVISDYTAGSTAFGSTSTTVANLSASVCDQLFPNLAEIFNYDGFNFHQSQVTDAAFVDSSVLSEAQIQAFFVAHGSFLANFILVGRIGGFEDLNGNGALDPGEPTYVVGLTPIPLHAHGLSAANVFAMQTVAQGVNPKVLLATSEKEQSLISRATLPSATVLNFAMGCGSPNNFVAQVGCAAHTFINQFTLTPSEPFFFPKSTGIRQFVTGLGRQPVGFQVNTAATYAQYKYTPHIQALANGGGVYLFEQVWKRFGF
ncbi:MAG TPA: hypothetical protein VGV68_08740 [Terriglobia bacterium]|nr:hypothetical protein [Terriglobia bacterium]